MPGREPPENDQEFLDYFAGVYRHDCPCDDCDRFRGILDLEEGVEVDLEEEYGLDTTVSSQQETQGDTCDVCNEREAVYTMTNDGVSCDECWKEAYIGYCPACEEFFHFEDGEVSWRQFGECGGDTLHCPECVRHGEVESFRCVDCMSSYPQDSVESIWVHARGEVCKPCYDENYIECHHCEEVRHQTEFTGRFLGPRHGEVCQPCIDHHYDTCPTCGDIRNQEDRTGCSCPNDGLWNYSWTPPEFHYFVGSQEKPHSPNVHARGTGRLYFGIENEIEVGRFHPREEGTLFIKETDLFYAKRDSTLDNGFEVVSHPFTWGWYKENYERFHRVWSELRDMGFRAEDTSTCGMHIHLAKPAFTRLQLLKFMRMIYNNPRFTVDISGRGSRAAMNRYGSIDGEDSSVLTQKARRQSGSSQNGRYCAVNVAPNNTVEVRVFRGTLQRDSIDKNLEFCHSLYEYARRESLKDISKKRYINFIADNHKKYHALGEFLTDHGLS